MLHIPSFAGSPILPPTSFILPYVSGFVLIVALAFLFIHFQNKNLSFGHKVKELLVWTGFLILGTGIFSALYFLTPPKVVSTDPQNGTDGFDPKSPISITFDKPVGRRILNKTLTPEVPGTWVFEDPLYSTHLYRKVVFYPDIGFDSSVSYTVRLTGIENTLATSKPSDLVFSFKTRANAVVAQALNTVKSQTVKLSVPVYLQQHTLSCEVASLKMTLAYKGITKSEDELLAEVGVDNTPHIGGTWGNPYMHFVGNVNGKQLSTGYGVYWGPIERVAKMYGNATAFQKGNIKMITDAVNAGNPVIIWVYSKSGAPTHWTTPDGTYIFAVAGEHTVVAVGYVGPAGNPSQIIVNDSLVGQSYWSRSYFEGKWATFNQAGVIVYK